MQKWFDIGHGVEIMRYEPGWDHTKNPAENLSQIQAGDLISLRISEPKRCLVAVDTGVKPHALSEDDEELILPAQVDWVYPYPAARTLQCTCLSPEKIWMRMDLSLKYQAPFEADYHFSTILTPPLDFGKTAISTQDIHTALQQCASTLRNGKDT